MNRYSAFATVAVAAAVAVSSASANVIDTIALRTPAPTTFTDSAGATYSLTASQPAGSGVFDPFMRISHEGNSQGYNSSLNNGPNSTMDLINLPGNASPQLPLNSVLTDDFKAMLTLDYNEPGATGKSLIDLTELYLVVSTDPDKTGPAGPAKKDPWTIQSVPLSPGDQVVYQMSNNVDGSNNPFQIQMDADNNPANGNGGSGAADLNVTIDLSHVPNLASLLNGNHYLYVYSRFSDTGAGFEEWSSFERVDPLPGGGGGQAPEPASLALLGGGGLALLARRRVRR